MNLLLLVFFGVVSTCAGDTHVDANENNKHMGDDTPRIVSRTRRGKLLINGEPFGGKLSEVSY